MAAAGARRGRWPGVLLAVAVATTATAATIARIATAATGAESVAIDDFEGGAPGWTTATSEGARLVLSVEEEARGHVLRLDFDL
ncbi:hypothetical protein L6Q96_23515, partial [Candidatus Binatia bacterium]|nr:hypothetical protein [Candidatus Binatia bacterium]